MINKKTLYILGLILGLILLSDSVSATIYGSGLNLNSILQPFGSVNVASFYIRYSAFIDAVIYLILFLSLAQLVFVKVYKDAKKEAKLVSVAVSLALTVSMVIFEMNTGFYLGKLYPIALFVFLAVLAMLLYNLLLGLFTGANGKSVSAAFTYLIIYGLFIVPFNVLNDWVIKSAPYLASILVLGAVVSFVYLLIQMFNALDFKGDTTPLGGTTTTTPPATTPATTTPPVVPPVTPPPANYPNDLAYLINNDYPNMLNELVRRYTAYSQQFEVILTKRHNPAGPAGSPIATDYARLVHLRDDRIDGMSPVSDEANRVLSIIRNDPAKYALLNATDLATFHRFMNWHGNILHVIIQNEIEARNAYNGRALHTTRTIPQP